MMKVPKSAAYFVLVVLFVAAIYMVYVAEFGWSNPVDADVDADVPGVADGEDVDAIFDGNEPSEWDFSRGEEFFIEYRLERERVRSKEVDILNQMINNPNVSEGSKADAERKLLELQDIMEMELIVENAVKAQGFSQAAFIMQKEGATIVVSATELSSQEIMSLAQIVSKTTGLRPSQINISYQAGK